MSVAFAVHVGRPNPSCPTLHGRSFLKELDFTVAEWRLLIELAGHLKADRRAGRERQQLRGRNLALVFEKSSTLTRCAFEVAAFDQGARVTYLDTTGSHLGHQESPRDTARVLGRMYDAIGYCGFSQRWVEDLAASAHVPVWNGLTDQWHPTQSLCDVFTMAEHSTKPLSGISIAYLGDARNTVANSLLVTGALVGMSVSMVAPRDLWNPPSVIAAAERIARSTGARIRHTADVAEGVVGADFVYTDVWLSMGEPPERWAERIDALSGYAVTADVMSATRNSEAKFMHCLPALHSDETGVGRQLQEATGRTFLEVDDEVFESSASLVFDQAENRLHTIKAIMVATLGELTCASS